jgi:hypothetical protein
MSSVCGARMSAGEWTAKFRASRTDSQYLPLCSMEKYCCLSLTGMTRGGDVLQPQYRGALLTKVSISVAEHLRGNAHQPFG